MGGSILLRPLTFSPSDSMGGQDLMTRTNHVISQAPHDCVHQHYFLLKACFRCSHCNGLLVISRYCSIDGVLHCKPHYQQLFKETGSFRKKITTTKVSYLFSGTQDRCTFCNKTADPPAGEVEGESYHKSCFRCWHGGCSLTPSTYDALDRILYCKPHFSQLFKQKGSNNHLTESTSSKKFLAPKLVDQQQEEIAAN